MRFHSTWLRTLSEYTTKDYLIMPYIFDYIQNVFAMNLEIATAYQYLKQSL